MNREFFGALTFAKVGLFIACGLNVTSASSQSFSKQNIETEAQRLEAVRAIVRQEKSRRLVGDADGKPKSTAAFCEGMLDDLLSNKGFKPIEPVAVLDFEYPIWNRDLPQVERDRQAQVALEKMGQPLAANLRRCADDGRGDIVKFDGLGSAAGAPPYRLYMLPRNINPFPDSSLMYWSEYVEQTGSGRKGYSWVNLGICEHTNGTPSLTDSLRLKKDPQGQRSALTLHQGKVVTWDVARGFLFSAHVVLPKPESSTIFEAICSWATFPEEPVRK